MYLFAFLFFPIINLYSQDYKPVPTRTSPVTDTFFCRYKVVDQYRWLENTQSPEVIDWVDQQNKASSKYLERACRRTESFDLINHYAYTRYDNPQKLGKYYFTNAYYNDHGGSAIFFQTKLDANPEILVDPMEISTRDKIRIGSYSLSKDSKLLAFQFSRNGSDWQEAMVVTMSMGKFKNDHLTGLKFSHLAWKDDGFFYTTHSQDGKFGETYGPKVFYHKIGSTQEDDHLVFGRPYSPGVTIDYLTSSDERFFILKERNETKGIINVFYIDYQSGSDSLKPLIQNMKKFNLDFLDSHDGKLIATAYSAKTNRSIVEINPADPYHWRGIGDEFSDAVLQDVIPFADRLVAVYNANQHPNIIVMDYKGGVLYKNEMPVATSVGGFSGDPADEELLYYFTSYTVPPIVYKFNIKTFKNELTQQTSVTFDYRDIEYKELEYPSSDGVMVPIVLVYKKGLVLDGNHPAILNAYGGFGIISQPSFDPGIVYFVIQGGVYAFANIRGGGDKGIKWALDGRGDNKQNSFDDFIAAAQYLLENKYTSRSKLAATGASNGGLVVAASAIQRPDLFKAVVPVVAPLDMLRFEKFTIGHWHTDEYGTVKDSSSFKKLLAYSPYQNIEDNINYPSMLVITSENDDRVPPLNSFKFVARLQNRVSQVNPVFLKTEMNAGHNGASTLFNSVQSKAYIYGFIMNELTNK